MGRKTTVWILQTTNWKDCTPDELDMAKKVKPNERNWISLYRKQKKNIARIIGNKIVRVGYVAIEMKWLIT